MKKILYTVLFILVSIIATGCTEKDDFIPEPTPTSVIVSGRVTTTAGKPLANIPVYIDFKRSFWLGPQNTLHKAKTKTDNNGRYRLFFEPEQLSGPESGASEGYHLYADLNDLSSKEYIKPNDLDEDRKDIYWYGIYRELAQSENLEINLHFPRKKEVTAECRGFIADRSLAIRNTIVYGVDYESLSRTVELDPDGNGTALIPCAADEANHLDVLSTLSIPEFYSKEIVFDSNRENKIVFDNNEVLESCRFRLSLYDYFSFDGEPYENKEATSTPAPFDFLGFRILLPDGQYEAFGTQRYQYYDSIVWCSPDFPETFKVYEKNNFATGTQEHLVTQWGSYFFDPGIHKTMLKG
ncbi:MAG: carboxypeptidase-like regulatory domain-containing protein, partial [Muribaculaceae bacterium]|nr:carboxypeptidase-like regulatory domain-containing protein [Muribaculaceae bacterium]